VTPATRGRPTLYTPEIAEQICKRLAAGESLQAICADQGLPDEVTVRDWAIQDRSGFSAQYRRARAIQASHYAEEQIGMADEIVQDRAALTPELVNATKLRVDARRWFAARVAPKDWGDRLDVSGEIDCKLSVQFSIAPAAHLARVELPASVRALLPAPGVARSAELPGEQSAK